MTAYPADLDRSRGVRAIALLYPGMWAQPRYAHLPLDVGAYLMNQPQGDNRHDR